MKSKSREGENGGGRSTEESNGRRGEEGKEGRLKKRRAVNREKGQIPWNSDCFSTWTCENHLRRKLPKALWKAE